MLKLYGAGKNRAYVDQLRRMAESDARIEFCGVYAAGQVGQILAGVDVMVIPSLWYETYSLILHESLACGVPVVASDIGVLAQTIEHNVNGFLCKMGDIAGLHALLQQIVDDPALCAGVKRRLRARPLRTIFQEASDYAQIYDKILN